MLDIFIVIVIGWALFSGWRNGLLKEITSTLGYLLGLIIAATCYSAFGSYLTVNGTQTNMVTSIIAFFILWVISPIVLGLAAHFLTKFLKKVHLGKVNSLGGAVVSLVKFSILLSCVLSAMSALHILDEGKAANSHLYGPFKNALGTAVDYAINDEDSVRTFTPADQSATKNDTTWIEIHHDKNANPKK